MKPLIPAFALTHTQQARPVGCIYHAAHAIVGDATLLEHVLDTHTGRWTARLAQRGWLLSPLFSSYKLPDARPMHRDHWEGARSLAQAVGATTLPVLITVTSPRVDGMHMVAALLPHRDASEVVELSDPALPELLRIPWAEFLRSEYAQAYQLLQPYHEQAVAPW